MIITIDGPTASGKSSVGRLLAQELGAYYLYTGLLYRALAYILMKDYGYTLESIAVPNLADVQKVLDPKRFIYCYDDQQRERIFFDEVDITPFLKDSATIDQAASIISTNNDVRNALNTMQREIANQQDVVIDGRDSGSVVFPHADYKIFLTASEKERAKRWQLQQEKKGNSVTFDQALSALKTRDERDAKRVHAPLIIPEGAKVIDNTGMSIDQTVMKILKIIQGPAR